MYLGLKQVKAVPILIYSLLSVLLLIWFVIHPQKHLNHDLAYLTVSAVHMLDGEKMSEAYSDTNPPLSIIVQAPAALIIKYTNIPIYYAVFIQAIILVVLSSLFLFFILGRLLWINEQEKLVFLSSYILVNTLMTGYEFGQKDHYIILFLLPLALLQALITYRINVPSLLKWSILIAGGFFILLKPHYGLIPAAMFIHRAVIQRRVSVVFDKDFLCLGILFCLYITVIYVFFSDYITKILPDILMFYVSDIFPSTIVKGASYAFFVLSFIIGCLFIFKKPQGFIIFLFLMSMLSIVPFVIQGKGVDYHSIPARTFFICGLAIFSMRIISASFQKIFKNNHIYLAMFGALLIISIIIYPFFTRPLARMSHSEYRDTQLVKVLQQCSNNDAVFIYDARAYTTHLLPVYAEKTHASRFPFLWFVRHFLKMEQKIKQGEGGSISKEELDGKIKKYGDMIAQDINKYKPGIILISPINYFQSSEKPFLLKQYFSKYSDEFRNIWSDYDQVQELTVDRTPYIMKETPYNKGIYEVYKHKECK